MPIVGLHLLLLAWSETLTHNLLSFYRYTRGQTLLLPFAELSGERVAYCLSQPTSLQLHFPYRLPLALCLHRYTAVEPGAGVHNPWSRAHKPDLQQITRMMPPTLSPPLFCRLRSTFAPLP